MALDMIPPRSFSLSARNKIVSKTMLTPAINSGVNQGRHGKRGSLEGSAGNSMIQEVVEAILEDLQAVQLC